MKQPEQTHYYYLVNGKLIQNILIIPIVVTSCYIENAELNVLFLSISLILILQIK